MAAQNRLFSEVIGVLIALLAWLNIGDVNGLCLITRPRPRQEPCVETMRGNGGAVEEIADRTFGTNLLRRSIPCAYFIGHCHRDPLAVGEARILVSDRLSSD
jgi:hypothetical protein